ncbi:polymorphic toxin type 4 domain-containing protein [Modestobacter lapidis]|nr:hypothetical protein [Modestobacter lapidis]
MTTVRALRLRLPELGLRAKPEFRAHVDQLEARLGGTVPREHLEAFCENLVVLGVIQGGGRAAGRTAARIGAVMEMAGRLQAEYARLIAQVAENPQGVGGAVTTRLQALTQQLTAALDDIGEPAAQLQGRGVADLVDPPPVRPGPPPPPRRLTDRPRPAHIPAENVVQVTPRRVRGGWDIPALGRNEMHVFPGGERVWRTPSGEIVIEWVLGRGRGRAGYEKDLPARSEYDLPEYADALLERAHAAGQGTGFEAPHAIRLAAGEVNQRVQRWGIELFLRRLRDRFPRSDYPDLQLEASTTTATVPGTLRLQSIDYRVDAVHGGNRDWLMQFRIEVGGEVRNPRLTIPPDSVVVGSSPGAQALLLGIDMADVHAMFAGIDQARPIGRTPPPRDGAQ